MPMGSYSKCEYVQGAMCKTIIIMGTIPHSDIKTSYYQHIDI